MRACRHMCATQDYPNPKEFVRSSRGKYRSRTFPKLERAIALQWSDYIINTKSDLLNYARQKYRQAFIRLIHRIREKLLEKGGYDVYQSLTDEEVFTAWLNKQSIAKVLADKCQILIPFDIDKLNQNKK